MENINKLDSVDQVEPLDKFVKADDKGLFEIIGTSEESIDRLSSAPYSYWRETFKTLFKNKVAILCFGILFVLVFFTIFGPMMKHYDYYAVTNLPTYVKPFGSVELTIAGVTKNYTFWFGTNGTKKDIWSVTWDGARISLLLAVVVSLINAVLGLFIGSVWGFFPKLDPIFIELRNFVSNVPSLLFYILFMKWFSGKVPTFWAIVIVLCIFGYMGLAATLRNNIIIIRNRDFNIASKTLGSKPTAIIVHNLLPYLVSIIVTILATSIPGVIDSEVSLSFFNLSYAGQLTLGGVITAATSASNDWMAYPFTMLIPSAIVIALTVACYYIGFSLADATDPRNHR